MDLRKIGVKFFMEKDSDVPLGTFINIFHRFIQEDKLEGLPIDVAEYTHVHQGPGVLLIAHEANYSFDETDGKRGFLYVQKRVPEMATEGYLKTAMRRTLKSADILEKEPEVSGKLKFNVSHFEVFVNDRLAAPANAQSREAFETAVKPFLENLYMGSKLLLLPQKDPKKNTGFEVRADKPFQIHELLAKLS